MSDPAPKLSLELFDPEIIALNREVAHHPKLREILRAQENRDTYILLLEIASYCEVLVIAELYTKQDILELCEKLTKCLYEKRTQVIIPFK